jgi:hypothetical protein
LKAPREWRLEYGVEWQASVDQANTDDSRFRENLEVLEDAIGIDPFRHGRALTPEVDTDRFATTKDIASGYRMVIFFRVDRSRATCTLEWLMLERL